MPPPGPAWDPFATVNPEIAALVALTLKTLEVSSPSTVIPPLGPWIVVE
jgi:hypothetical protein